MLMVSMKNKAYREAYATKFFEMVNSEKIKKEYLKQMVDSLNIGYTYNSDENAFYKTDDGTKDNDGFFQAFAREWDTELKKNIRYRLDSIVYYNGKGFFKQSSSLNYFVNRTEFYKGKEETEQYRKSVEKRMSEEPKFKNAVLKIQENQDLVRRQENEIQKIFQKLELEYEENMMRINEVERRMTEADEKYNMWLEERKQKGAELQNEKERLKLENDMIKQKMNIIKKRGEAWEIYKKRELNDVVNEGALATWENETKRLIEELENSSS